MNISFTEPRQAFGTYCMDGHAYLQACRDDSPLTVPAAPAYLHLHLITIELWQTIEDRGPGETRGVHLVHAVAECRSDYISCPGPRGIESFSLYWDHRFGLTTEGNTTGRIFGGDG